MLHLTPNVNVIWLLPIDFQKTLSYIEEEIEVFLCDCKKFYI